MRYLKEQFLIGFQGGLSLFFSPFVGFAQAFRNIWTARFGS